MKPLPFRAILQEGIETHRPRIRRGRAFRRKPAGHSDGSQPVIPTEASHPFRGKPATPGGVRRGSRAVIHRRHGGFPHTGSAMPAERLPMRQVREVLRLKYVCGHSGQQIAAMVGRQPLHGRRISAPRRRCGHHLAGAAGARRRSAGAQAVHAAVRVTHRRSCAHRRTGRAIHAELRRPGVTLLLLWEEYRAGQPEGYGYSRFCDLYAAWRGRLSPTMRQSHPAGERLFVDYAGQTVEVIDATHRRGAGGADFRGRAWRVQLHLRGGPLDAVAAGLDWLPRRRVRLLRRRRAADLVCDNLKAGVTAACRYEPGINRTYQDMASHYGTAVRADAGAQAARQGQGRGRRAGGAALGAGAAATSPVLLPGRTERRDPRADRRPQRPPDAPSRHQPSCAVRGDRARRPAAAAGRAVCLCGMAALPCGHRLPRRGARPFLFRSLPADARGDRRAHHRPDRGAVPPRHPRRQPPAQPARGIGTPPRPSTCPVRTAATPTGRRRD